MRVRDTTKLDQPANVTRDAHGDICRLAKGQKVLNVGAAGNARYYRDHGHDGWLHAALAEAASILVGLDLDKTEVTAANNMGFAVQLGNCEDAQLEDNFDLIVLADVLEHVDNPTRALQNLMAHLEPGGKIVVTTPNATFFGNVTNALLRRGPNIYWDHVNLYTPENIQALCDRHGWHLSNTAMYSLTDGRSTANKIKSAIIHMAAGLFPRLHASFICIIESAD